jgi:hypothetical protein
LLAVVVEALRVQTIVAVAVLVGIETLSLARQLAEAALQNQG